MIAEGLLLLSLFTNAILSSTSVPTIIWWTPLTNQYNNLKTCGSQKCFFTDRRDRDTIKNKTTKAFLFYGSNLDYYDLPLPRQKHHVWGLLHEESPKNVPFLQNEEILEHFNYTSTFSRFSDLPLTLEYLKSLDMLTTTKYFLSVDEKNAIKTERNLASIVYLQSHCDAPSRRDEYVAELMKYVKIDAYGKCLHNKELPKSLSDDYLQTIQSDELFEFLGNYKFQIAFENAVCSDYITEKFWRPLISGSVPIYFGSPSIEDWLPNNKSAILIKDFSSPYALAQLIQQLDSNDDDYNNYLSHKMGIDGITNDFLLNEINKWTGRRRNDEGIIGDFECFICHELHKKNYTLKSKSANRKHYDCGEQLVLPPMEFTEDDFDWVSIMNTGKITAKVVNSFLVANKPIYSGDYQRVLAVEAEQFFSAHTAPQSRRDFDVEWNLELYNVGLWELSTIAVYFCIFIIFILLFCKLFRRLLKTRHFLWTDK